MLRCDTYGYEVAFKLHPLQKSTELDRCHIVDYSVDEIYDKNGDPIGG